MVAEQPEPDEVKPAAIDRMFGWIKSSPRNVAITVAAVVMVLGSIVAGGLAGIEIDTPRRTTTTANSGVLEQIAIVMCQDFVRDALKAPSTAEFGRPTLVVQTGDRWKVEGPVDAQNGFGAMIRNDYVCVVEHDPTDAGWTLKSLSGFDSGFAAHVAEVTEAP